MTRGQSWLTDKVEVRPSAAHNKGVFANRPLKKGERVAVFGGDVMRADDIQKLPEQLRAYALQIEERFVLADARGLEPEDSDFFNHSCDPTCGFKGQLFLVAMRDIGVGEEVTFDYAMVLSPLVGNSTVFDMECTCNAPNCRRRVTQNDWRIPELRRRYQGYFSQYLQDKIDAEEATAVRGTSTSADTTV